MTDAIAPPAERPVTKTRLRSTPYFSTALAIISRMDRASPQSRAVSPESHQKQFFGLFAAAAQATEV